MGYGVWLHGEAVAAGSLLAADLSRRLGWIAEAEVERMRKLFELANLPTLAPDLGVEKYLESMGLDKKVEGGKMRFILLRAIGAAAVSGDVPDALLKETLCGAYVG